MKKIQVIILTLATLVSMASCDKDNHKTVRTFRATAERSKDDGKISLSGGSLLWSAGDSIRIYDGGGNCANYLLLSGAGEVEGVFDYSSGDEIAESPYKAVYPARFFSGSSQITLPNVQRTADGSLREPPMYAVSDDEELSFYNVCGVVRFRLTARSSVNLRSIALTTDVATNGTATLSGSGTSTTIGTPDGTTTTILLCETAQSIASAHDFYMYLPAGSYTGLSIRLMADDKSSCTKSTSGTINVQRGKICTITLTNLNFTNPGTLPGEFSVAADRTVRFSMGNLQYQASTSTWHLAEHQWDYVGSQNPSYGSRGGTVAGSDNIYISSSYSGWIDLFGWGTSGYHDAADSYNIYYQPWSTSMDTVDVTYNCYGYGPSTNMTDLNLTGTSANYDWGVYNAISNGGNAAGLWRTMTDREWEYLINTRSASTVNGTANARYTKAMVNDINGAIFFPDSYAHPTDVAQPVNINTQSGHHTDNMYTTNDWMAMEACGAVFLPAAGRRNGTRFLGARGSYWTASMSTNYFARSLNFDDANMNIPTNNKRYDGRSVRLVKD
ncbi:MAG: hypothetical protein J6X62_02935 [Bacteroidales bacterium]|nr:hypothetical protein [Bacteroidales bacterium]